MLKSYSTSQHITSIVVPSGFPHINLLHQQEYLESCPGLKAALLYNLVLQGVQLLPDGGLDESVLQVRQQGCVWHVTKHAEGDSNAIIATLATCTKQIL